MIFNDHIVVTTACSLEHIPIFFDPYSNHLHVLVIALLYYGSFFLAGLQARAVKSVKHI